MELKDLLNDVYIILQQCDLVLSNSIISENFMIIRTLKLEFEEIALYIEKYDVVPVLNKRRGIYSTHLIVDSANLNNNEELFDLIFAFSKKIKKVNKKHIYIKKIL